MFSNIKYLKFYFILTTILSPLYLFSEVSEKEQQIQNMHRKFTELFENPDFQNTLHTVLKKLKDSTEEQFEHLRSIQYAHNCLENMQILYDYYQNEKDPEKQQASLQDLQEFHERQLADAYKILISQIEPKKIKVENISPLRKFIDNMHNPFQARKEKIAALEYQKYEKMLQALAEKNKQKDPQHKKS